MSLALILDMVDAALGDRIALGTRAAGVGFHGVAEVAARGAAVIAEHEPSHVLFVGRNGPAYPQLLFACAVAGVPFVPMNYRLADDVLNSLIDDFECPLIVADGQYLARLGDRPLLVTTDRFFALAAAAEPMAPVSDDDTATAVLLHTSGTTARPKVVSLRHENLLSYVLSTVELASADPDEATLVSLPPYHVAAVGSALSNFYAGRRVLHLPDFDPDSWIDLVESESITSAMVVPTMLARIVDAVGDRVDTCPSLRLISYGGARMPQPVLRRALSLFPHAGFCNAYGLTETSSTLALLGPEDHRAALAADDARVRDRLASVGRPVPGVEVQIRDGDGMVVASNVVGELFVRGPQVSGRYEGIGSVLDADGWFPTRDRARLDDAGYLFIEGRADDTIIRGGENISPAEVEDVLYEHPAVKDVAVIGLADDEWGGEAGRRRGARRGRGGERGRAAPVRARQAARLAHARPRRLGGPAAADRDRQIAAPVAGGAVDRRFLTSGTGHIEKNKGDVDGLEDRPAVAQSGV